MGRQNLWKDSQKRIVTTVTSGQFFCLQDGWLINTMRILLINFWDCLSMPNFLVELLVLGGPVVWVLAVFSVVALTIMLAKLMQFWTLRPARRSRGVCFSRLRNAGRDRAEWSLRAD